MALSRNAPKPKILGSVGLFRTLEVHSGCLNCILARNDQFELCTVFGFACFEILEPLIATKSHKRTGTLSTSRGHDAQRNLRDLIMQQDKRLRALVQVKCSKMQLKTHTTAYNALKNIGVKHPQHRSWLQENGYSNKQLMLHDFEWTFVGFDAENGVCWNA